jgi:hypothetical protein
MIWHVLDVRAIWIKEFAAALSAQTPTLGWCPRITAGGVFRDEEEETTIADPELPIRYFPLQRGFARFPVNAVAREGHRIARRLRQRSDNPDSSPLICSSPHYASTAHRWDGPVIYYVTDLFTAYREEPAFIRGLDRKMCQVAALVCPNSNRIADYLMREAQCGSDKIVVIPNATRKANIFEQVPQMPCHLPSDIADLPRPIAGVIGNLGANMDWILLRNVIASTPWLSWVFVGPTIMSVPDPEQNEARRYLMQCGGLVRFVGEKRYGELRDYARAIDVAILPYRKIEPTYSGSSTRFFEHLAACRPIVATRGVEEVLHKEPLLALANSATEMAGRLEELRQQDFHDGYEEKRWRASQSETWEARALRMRTVLAEIQSDGREAA